LEEGQTGFCEVRKNVGGGNVDALSGLVMVGFEAQRVYANFPGCNLQCPFCVYPFLSRWVPRGDLETLPPGELVNLALAMEDHAMTISGGEPTLHHEYVLSLARLCRENGVFTILLTNGYISPWLAEILAKNVDLPVIGVKGSASPSFYARMNADAHVVLESTRIFHQNAKDIIICYVTDPSFGTTARDHKRYATWVVDNLGRDVRVFLEYLHTRPTNTIQPYPFPDYPDETWRYIQWVASTLMKSGLTNVTFFDIRLLMRTGTLREVGLLAPVAVRSEL